MTSHSGAFTVGPHSVRAAVVLDPMTRRPTGVVFEADIELDGLTPAERRAYESGKARAMAELSAGFGVRLAVLDA